MPDIRSLPVWEWAKANWANCDDVELVLKCMEAPSMCPRRILLKEGFIQSFTNKVEIPYIPRVDGYADVCFADMNNVQTIELIQNDVVIYTHLFSEPVSEFNVTLAVKGPVDDIGMCYVKGMYEATFIPRVMNHPLTIRVNDSASATVKVGLVYLYERLEHQGIYSRVTKYYIDYKPVFHDPDIARPASTRWWPFNMRI